MTSWQVRKLTSYQVNKLLDRAIENLFQVSSAMHAWQRLLKKEDIYGYAFSGKRYDLGDKFDWLRINIELALERDEFSDKLRTLLKNLSRAS